MIWQNGKADGESCWSAQWRRVWDSHGGWEHWTGDRQIQMLEGEVEMPDSTLDWKDEEDTGGKFMSLSSLVSWEKWEAIKEMISGWRQDAPLGYAEMGRLGDF